jgi:hypothetical protein
MGHAASPGQRGCAGARAPSCTAPTPLAPCAVRPLPTPHPATPNPRRPPPPPLPTPCPRRRPASDALLVVTLLDGAVVGVDREAGHVLWTFDSGKPLVSSKQSQGNGFNVFPGADGGLYAYHGMTKAQGAGLEVRCGGGGEGQGAAGRGSRPRARGRARLRGPANGAIALGPNARAPPRAPHPPWQRLPLSLPELVAAAPSLTADGSLIVGRRESRVFVLDRNTGQPLATLGADGADQASQLAWAGGRSPGCTGGQRRRARRPRRGVSTGLAPLHDDASAGAARQAPRGPWAAHSRDCL